MPGPEAGEEGGVQGVLVGGGENCAPEGHVGLDARGEVNVLVAAEEVGADAGDHC